MSADGENTNPLSQQAEECLEPTANPTDARPQFGIRFLLALTTGLAAALGLAVGRGWGTLPLSLGMIWSTINASGHLRFAQQTPRARSNWIWLAWGLFLLSLVLPVAKGCSGEKIYGWEAASFVVGGEVDFIYKSFTRDSEIDWPNVDWLGVSLFLGWMTSLNLANLILLLAPLVIVLYRYQTGDWVIYFIACTSILLWAFPLDDEDFPFSGYWIWSASAAALTSCRPLPWRVWWSMIGVIALIWILTFRNSY